MPDATKQDTWGMTYRYVMLIKKFELNQFVLGNQSCAQNRSSPLSPWMFDQQNERLATCTHGARRTFATGLERCVALGDASFELASKFGVVVFLGVPRCAFTTVGNIETWE